MNQLQQTEFEIGGNTYRIGLLSFENSRPAYVKLQRLLQANEEILAIADIGLFMFCGMTGAIDDEDLKYYVELFAPVTSVVVGAQQTLFLKDKAARDLLFAGKIEDMFAWLDAGVTVNFASAREKLAAARKRVNAHVAAKVQAEAEKKDAPTK